MNAGRALSTVGIWTAITVLGGLLITSTRETVMELITSTPLETFDGQTIMIPNHRPITTAMPEIWLITVGVLLLALLVVAAAATLAVWRTSAAERAALTVGATAAESAKAKREQEARLRLRRLLAHMDEDEMAAALDELENPRAIG
jgi:hypothetical protein